MAELFHPEGTLQRIYWDRRFYNTVEENIAALKGSSTVYVGNIDPKSTEQQIHETFSRVGPIRKVIMGLNKNTKEPCGFCFVEYYAPEHAMSCLKHISGSFCGDREIRCELDPGFKPSRQYGRGAQGGQVRNDKKIDINYGPSQKRGRDSYGSEDNRRQSYGGDSYNNRGAHRQVMVDFRERRGEQQQRKKVKYDPLVEGLSAPRAGKVDGHRDNSKASDDNTVEKGEGPQNITGITLQGDEVNTDNTTERSEVQEERPTKNPRFRSDDEDEDKDNDEE